MHYSSQLLLRTQSTLRLIELADAPQKERLKHVLIGLGLIERILTRIVESPAEGFEAVVLETLDESIRQALTAIDEDVGEDKPSDGIPMEPDWGRVRRAEAILNKEGCISIIWTVADVYVVIEDCGLPFAPSPEEAMDVLRVAERRHDAAVGINWEVLAYHVETVLGEDAS